MDPPLTENLPFTPMLEPPADEGASSTLVFSVKGDAVHVAPSGLDDHGADLYLGRMGNVDCWAIDIDGDDEL